MGKKKANQPRTKINTLSGACIIFPFHFANQLYIYMFPKVASNAGCLPFWLPIFSKKWTHFQMCWDAAVCSGVSRTCSCSANLNGGLKSLVNSRSFSNTVSTGGNSNQRKGAKELKWLHFLCLFPWAAPSSGGNLCLRRSWNAFAKPWSCPSSLSAALAPQAKPQGSSCSILFLLNKPRPKEAFLRGQHSSVALWAFSLTNLCDNTQVLVQIRSSGKLQDLHGLFRFCSHPCPWDWGPGRVLLAKRCMWRLEMRAVDATEHLITAPAPRASDEVVKA